MMNEFSRTELLYGPEAMEKLAMSRVAVFGIGGVGGYVVEALARSGVGALDLIDNDQVCLSNLNRQIIATHDTIGRYKVDVAAERVHAIHPNCIVRTYQTFFLPETQDQFDFTEYDYVVDAIDTVTGKLAIIVKADESHTPVISSMGAGNKIHPALFEVADLYKTSVCPLAKVMRRECKKRGIKHLKVVYSKEEPRKPLEDLAFLSAEKTGTSSEQTTFTSGSSQKEPARRSTPGSTAFAPSVVGLIIAGEVINDLTGVH